MAHKNAFIFISYLLFFYSAHGMDTQDQLGKLLRQRSVDPQLIGQPYCAGQPMTFVFNVASNASADNKNDNDNHATQQQKNDQKNNQEAWQRLINEQQQFSEQSVKLRRLIGDLQQATEQKQDMFNEQLQTIKQRLAMITEQQQVNQQQQLQAISISTANQSVESFLASHKYKLFFSMCVAGYVGLYRRLKGQEQKLKNIHTKNNTIKSVVQEHQNAPIKTKLALFVHYVQWLKKLCINKL